MLSVTHEQQLQISPTLIKDTRQTHEPYVSLAINKAINSVFFSFLCRGRTLWSAADQQCWVSEMHIKFIISVESVREYVESRRKA
jgi:hypothetical protein